jgi:hypothetical protein
MNIKEAHKFAKDYDSKLLATDNRFNHWVHIIHHDGSTFLFNRAFILNTSDWIIVFTEHFKYHIFEPTDLVSKSQFDENMMNYTEKV